MDTEMIQEIIINMGWQIPTDAVKGTYRGRAGCGCGCRGTHSVSKRAVTLRTRFINEAIMDGRIELSHYGMKTDGCETVCFSYEDEDTYVWVWVDTSCLPMCNDPLVNEPAYAGSTVGGL